MIDLIQKARFAAQSLYLREMVRSGSEDASELRQSPEYRASEILEKSATEIERLHIMVKTRDQEIENLKRYLTWPKP